MRQTLLLYTWNQLFGWLPIETLIRERQDEYYRVLGFCDKAADSSAFIEFMLLYDFKESGPARHRQYTGAPQQLILENLAALDEAGALNERSIYGCGSQ